MNLSVSNGSHSCKRTKNTGKTNQTHPDNNLEEDTNKARFQVSQATGTALPAPGKAQCL